MERYILVDASSHVYIDPQRLGCEATSIKEALRCQAVGGTLMVSMMHCYDTFAGNIPCRQRGVGNFSSRYRFMRTDEVFRADTDFAGSRLIDVMMPPHQVGAEFLLGRGRLWIYDQTDIFAGSVEAAIGRTINSDRETPRTNHAFLTPEDVKNGTPAVAVSGTHAIDFKKWPDIEAPTLAGALRSPTLCTAMAIMFSPPEACADVQTRWNGGANIHARSDVTMSRYHDIVPRLHRAATAMLS